MMIRDSWMVILCVLYGLTAQAADTVLLWPNGAPGAVGKEDADRPSLRVYLPEKEQATGTAVVVCPGGAYTFLAFDHEGEQIARWYNGIGVAVFALKYRLAPRYHHPAPLQDVQRALKYVRANAERYGVSPQRIGVAGFSAGGHLAATASTQIVEQDPEAKDPLDRVSSRPDFAVLAYPVISMTAKSTHVGTKRNLLGDKPREDLAELLSNELQVKPSTPPTFLFHTGDDTVVPIEQVLAYYAACRKSKVPVELHAYQFGGHGVGLSPGDRSLATWTDHLHDWLRNSGLLADVRRAAVSGTITVNGQPIKWGQIRFEPKESTRLPSASAIIHDGRYHLLSDRGPAVGDYLIDVYDMGKFAPQPTMGAAVNLVPDGSIPKSIQAGHNPLSLDFKR